MNERERLMLQIMHRLSEKFKDRLVLKGGMLLRLLNSPRSTQDIDYVLLTKESRTLAVPLIKEAVETIDGLKITKTNLNSRGIFLELIAKEGFKILLEISIAKTLNCPTEPLTTQGLASSNEMTGRVIATMSLPEAFANKIAATIERDVSRDLYDLSLLEPLGSFDQTTLLGRLKKASIRRAKPAAISPQEAATLLEKRLESLDEKRLSQELFPLLPASQQREGLIPLIRASVSRIAQRLKEIH